MIGLTQGRKAFRTGKMALVAGLALAAIAGTNQAANAQSLLYGFTSTNQLFSFNSNTPTTILSTANITGVAGTLLDIDFRPANGLLYGLSFNAGLNLYTINTTTGAATLVSAAGLGSAAAGYDIDFNPMADALRIVGTNGDNFRVNNLNSGGSFNVDGTVTGAGSVVGAAYTNNLPGATSTTLYYINSGGTLFSSPTPNNGTVSAPIGTSPAIANTLLAFDIASNGTAFVLQNNTLYTENLANGAATLVGGVASPGGDIRGISATIVAAPEPGTFALFGMGLVSMGGIAVRRKAKKA